MTSVWILPRIGLQVKVGLMLWSSVTVPEDTAVCRVRSVSTLSFCIKLHTEVSGRLGMSGGKSPRHAQNPLSGERRKMLSITHHTLSPTPSHHHLILYIIHLINRLQRYYRIPMSLKCSVAVPKVNDVCHVRSVSTLSI